MKKILSSLLFMTLLVGCSNNENTNTDDSNSSEISSEVTEVGFEFTSGVDASNISYADNENYTNVEGTSHTGNDIYVIYEGTIVDVITPEKDGSFSYRSMSNDTQARLVFTDDTGLSIGDSGIMTSDLDFSKSINVYPNENYITDNAEQTTETSKYSMNEAVVLVTDTEDPVAEVKVTKATDNLNAFPDYLSATDYYDVSKLILIQIEYKNIAYPENISFGLYDFQVFSEDGKLLPDISQQNGGDPVAQGRTGTAEFYIESEEPQDKIELDFLPDGNSSPVATYIVDVEH